MAVDDPADTKTDTKHNSEDAASAQKKEKEKQSPLMRVSDDVFYLSLSDKEYAPALKAKVKDRLLKFLFAHSAYLHICAYLTCVCVCMLYVCVCVCVCVVCVFSMSFFDMVIIMTKSVCTPCYAVLYCW